MAQGGAGVFSEDEPLAGKRTQLSMQFIEHFQRKAPKLLLVYKNSVLKVNPPPTLTNGPYTFREKPHPL